MIQLSPQENFSIIRGLPDHTDSNTYYVQAVIRDAKTNEVIDTVNLADTGDGHLFSKEWQAPADIPGNGTWIVICTSVYSDAGYTTKAINYGDEYDTILVQERMNAVMGLGAGGPDIDYKRIRKIFEEVADTRKVEIPEAKPVDLSPVIASLGAIGKKIESIVIPTPKDVDFSPLEARMADIIKQIEAKPVTEVDFKPLFDKIKNLQSEVEKLKGLEKKQNMSMTRSAEQVQKQIDDNVNRLMEYFDNLAKTPFQVQFAGEAKPKEKSKRDISKL